MADEPVSPSTYANLSPADKQAVDAEILRGLLSDVDVGFNHPESASEEQLALTSTFLMLSVGGTRTNQPAVTQWVEQRIEDARETIAAAPFSLAEARARGPFRGNEVDALGLNGVNATRLTNALINMDGDQYTPAPRYPYPDAPSRDGRNR